MKNILKLIKAKLATRNSVDDILASFHRQSQALAVLEEAKRSEGYAHYDQSQKNLKAGHTALNAADRARHIQKKLTALID